MNRLPIRIDVGTEGDSVVIDVWAQEEVSADGKSGTWKLHEHLVINPPTIMEPLAAGELDPRD